MSVVKMRRGGSNVEIAYEVVGDRGGYPLAFMHGLGAGRAQTTSALTALNNTMLIAPDMLGHGDSVSEDECAVMSFDQSADDVVAILDHLGIEKSNIGGLSMGSGIALNIALRYPERVNQLILLRPSWLEEKKPAHLALVAYVGQWIIDEGAEVAEQKLLSHPDYVSLYAEVPKVAESIRGLFKRPAHFSHTAVLYKMWEDAPFGSLGDLGKIENDSLVLYTTRDNLHPIPVAESIADALPNLRGMEELAPRYDEPEEYGVALNEALNAFLHH